MWGDTDHIKKLKQGEPPPWPDDFPYPKKAKKREQQQQRADRAARKAADAEARALAKWGRMPPPAKPTKQPPAKRPNAADLADLKAAEWQAKQEARDAKAHQRALKATIRAEKVAQQAQRRAAAAEIQWLKEEQAHWKQERGGRSAAPNYTDYTPAYVPSAIGCGLSGCAGPALALLLLLILFLCICDCG